MKDSPNLENISLLFSHESGIKIKLLVIFKNFERIYIIRNAPRVYYLKSGIIIFHVSNMCQWWVIYNEIT